MVDFNRRVKLVACYLLLLLTLQCSQARKVPHRHSVTVQNLMKQTFSFSNITYMWCKHFCIIILYFRDVQAEFLPDYCNKSDDFWDSL